MGGFKLNLYSKKLVESFYHYLNSLPDNQNNRLSVVIPAKNVSHFMSQNLPILITQAGETITNGIIDGYDVVVVLNRGGDENDREFAYTFNPAGIHKRMIWERGGTLFSDANRTRKTNLSLGKGTENRIFFIVQDNVEENTGHSNALKTAFHALLETARTDEYCSKYYLTIDADNRLHTQVRTNGFEGNGLLALIEKVHSGDFFAVGARLKPAVFNQDGTYDCTKKVAGLIRATANLHVTTPGFQWSPGGGTVALGSEALAAHIAINDRDLEVPDVSFTLLAKKILKKKITVANDIFVVDASPQEEKITLSRYKDLRNKLAYWSDSDSTVEELIQNKEIPASWRKMIRWLHGQKVAEEFFGKQIIKSIVQPRISNIVLGNIKVTLQNEGLGLKAVQELLSLSREIPAYFTIRSSLKKKSSIGISGEGVPVSW